jgi:hypothetical protein
VIVVEVKRQLMNLVTKHHGSVSEGLHPTTHVLVTPAADYYSEKVEHANKWGLQVVTTDWVHDCVRSGGPLSLSLARASVRTNATALLLTVSPVFLRPPVERKKCDISSLRDTVQAVPAAWIGRALSAAGCMGMQGPRRLIRARVYTDTRP